MTQPANMTMQPIITAANVTELVNMYFDSQCLPEQCSAFGKYSIQYWKIGGNKYFERTIYENLYDIFWSIRLLAYTGHFDFDDIEFHVKKNPIFAEIDTDTDSHEKSAMQGPAQQGPAMQGPAPRPNQITLLRQAISKYKQNLAKVAAGRIKQEALLGIGAKL
jgi:hypothetical protein